MYVEHSVLLTQKVVLSFIHFARNRKVFKSWSLSFLFKPFQWNDDLILSPNNSRATTSGGGAPPNVVTRPTRRKYNLTFSSFSPIQRFLFFGVSELWVEKNCVIWEFPSLLLHILFLTWRSRRSGS